MTNTLLGKARARRITALENRTQNEDRSGCHLAWMQASCRQLRDEICETASARGLAERTSQRPIFTAA